MKSTVTIKYNPAFLTQEELVRAFVARHNDLELILEVIRENQENNSQHVLVVAPRGAGKTTLVLRVAAEIRLNKILNSKWYPVVFSEESYEVCSPGEFWLQAIFHIGEQAQNERWKKTYEDLHKETNEERLRERALAQLMDLADEQNKRLLLVVENLNMLLGQQITADDVWKLRHTLLNEPRIMLLGTATNRFAQLDNSENAMFELFKIHDLKPLDTEECRNLWESISGEKPSLKRIRPIQILTGGNPRLLVIISSFAAKKSFKELMENLTGLVDEHTEYFKSHLDNLPPLERKVFVALADLWRPATAREIAESSRIDVNKASANLQRLISKGAVIVADQKGRRKWYQIAERMYNIYHLMRRRGEPSDRVRAVVDFMVHFYADEDLVHLTKNVVTEACLFDPAICSDHYRFIAEMLKRPQVEKFWEKIIENIPNQIIKALDLQEVIGKEASVDESTTGTQRNKLTKEEIETGILKHPEDPRVLMMLARELINNHPDRLQEAKAACEKTIEIDPENVMAFGCLGYLLKDMERYEEAEEVFRRAIEIDPENVPALGSLGIFLHQLERYEEAEEAYKRAIEIDPEKALSWSSLGMTLHDLNRHAEAEEAYRRVIEIDPEDEGAWNNLGVLLSNNKKRHAESEKAFRKVTEIDPHFFVPWANLGLLLSKDPNRYNEAEKAYMRAVEIEPNASFSWEGLIKFQFESLKNPKKSFKTVEQFLEATDRSAQNLNLLARLLFENRYKKYFDKAEAWSKEAVEKDKEELAYKHTLAAILGGRGKWNESLKIARKFLKDKDFVKRRIKEVTDYLIFAAAAGHADTVIRLLEQHPDIEVLEPIIVGLKIFIGEEFRTAQEIKEIGQDVADRIRERMNNRE